MTLVVKHWDLRKKIKIIRTDPMPDKNGKPSLLGAEARYYVLDYLLSCCNTRLRCWPSIETIMEDTGFSKAPVTYALKYWESRGAIYNVPGEYRVGAERNLPGNKKVWQITGITEIQGEVFPYLFLQPETLNMVVEEVQKYGKAAQDILEIFARYGSLNEPKSFSNSLGIEDNTPPKSPPGDEPGGSMVFSRLYQQQHFTAPLIKALITDLTTIQEQAARDVQEKMRNKTISAIIKAHLVATGAIDPNAYKNKTKRQIAGAMADSGITPDDITDYIAHIQSESWRTDKAPSLHTVAAKIVAWKRDNPDDTPTSDNSTPPADEEYDDPAHKPFDLSQYPEHGEMHPAVKSIALDLAEIFTFKGENHDN